MQRAVWRGALLVVVGWAAAARGSDDFERPPIEYSQSTPENCISRLQEALDGGQQQLKFQDSLGYLPALLDALGVPVESQMLVFSQTSLQRHRISPDTPRAIYFNDRVYIGFCQSGDLLEITAVDPDLGAVFYTLDQEEVDRPQFVRQTDNCLSCHSSSRTGGIPGHLVRSLFVDSAGRPLLSAGSYSVDHTTPLEHRWGGWYVTGQHGSQMHLGNLVVQGRRVPRPVENPEGQNVTDLSDRLDVDRYLSPHSDIVALMVLEHQTLVHNRLAKANYVTRQALHYQAAMNRALGEPEGQRLESTTRRIASAGDELVEALLLVGEAELTEPVRGTSGFSELFSQEGPHDRQGRSLHQLDLQRRLFRYPCSYLIYSDAFRQLPEEMRTYVWRRLWKVLVEGADAKTFGHLSDEDRRAIVDILRQTHPDLPESWRTEGIEQSG